MRSPTPSSNWIHPFIDGNGRIGRARVNTILRRRQATRHVVIPLASAFVARRDRYFGSARLISLVTPVQ
ncbi:MAG: Fic family protein [Microthrixaceae bacterium]|nr:Fic family protein [Microthrixaceae bacterium]